MLFAPLVTMIFCPAGLYPTHKTSHTADALIHSGILPVLVGCLQAGCVSATEHPRFYHPSHS